MITYCGQEFDATPAQLYAFKTDWRRKPTYMYPTYGRLGPADFAKRELRIRDMALMGDLGWGGLQAVLPSIAPISDYWWRKREVEMREEFQEWLAVQGIGSAV